jgi:dUTP pyrophosphatase
MITFYQLDKNAILPRRSHKFDAGLDLYSTMDVTVAPQQWAKIATGLRVDIPENYYGQVCSRSGLALKSGLIVHQGVGVIDCGYEGELLVMLRNVSEVEQTVSCGDRIAQLLICPVRLDVPEFARSSPVSSRTTHGLEETSSPVSSRGAGGFGSTGH